MKIAILSFYSGYVERGVENWSHELATHLTSGNRITLFQAGTKRKSSLYTTVTINIPVDWERTDSRGSLKRKLFLDYWSLRIAFFTLLIIPSILKGSFDIIIPTNGGWQVAIIRIITFLTGKKMVIVGHSGKGWDERNNLYSFPNVFVALTTDAKKWARRVNPFVQVETIPDAVNTQKFSPKGKKLDVSLKHPIVLAVGALEKSKQLELAIKAVAHIPDASLLIVGRGPEENKLHSLGKKLLGKRFLITSVSYEQMPQVYRAADVFTLPSWENEAFGMVYIEAMACGLPVVSPDDAKRREIIGDAGMYVDPHNSESYASVLKTSIKKNWRGVPEKQAQKYSWTNVSERYEKLFAKLINT